MTPADRLERLGEAIQRDHDYQDESVVLDALPELVAVVRAAEDEQKAVQPLYRMRDALAALDARLAETEKGKDLGAEPGGSAVVEEGQHDG